MIHTNPSIAHGFPGDDCLAPCRAILPEYLDRFGQAVRGMTKKELEEAPLPELEQSGLHATLCRQDVESAIQAMLRKEYERGANQFNWICTPDECRAYNPYDCRQCRVCGSPRPQLYTKAEVEAARQSGLQEGEILGCIQGAEFANNVIYVNCPTGDVTAWDMLKGVQKTQEALNAFVQELKPILQPNGADTPTNKKGQA